MGVVKAGAPGLQGVMGPAAAQNKCLQTTWRRPARRYCGSCPLEVRGTGHRPGADSTLQRCRGGRTPAREGAAGRCSLQESPRPPPPPAEPAAAPHPARSFGQHCTAPLAGAPPPAPARAPSAPRSQHSAANRSMRWRIVMVGAEEKEN